MIKLIATDIDGTIVSHANPEISEELFAELERLLDKGISICVATGRERCSATRLFKKVSDRLYFSCCNGAALYDTGAEHKLIRKITMDKATAYEIGKQITGELGLPAMFNGDDISYVQQTGYPMDIYRAMKDYEKTYAVLVPSAASVPEELIKVTAMTGTLKETHEALYERWGNRFNVDIAGSIWVDITLSDKGLGIKDLAQHLGIEKDEIMAFGDNRNDAPMLDYVGHPFIVNPADEWLKNRYPNAESVLSELKKL